MARVNWDAQNASDERWRKRLSRQHRERLKAALHNARGFKRLRAIPGERWTEAVAASEGDDNAT